MERAIATPRRRNGRGERSCSEAASTSSRTTSLLLRRALRAAALSIDKAAAHQEFRVRGQPSRPAVPPAADAASAATLLRSRRRRQRALAARVLRCESAPAIRPCRPQRRGRGFEHQPRPRTGWSTGLEAVRPECDWR